MSEQVASVRLQGKVARVKTMSTAPGHEEEVLRHAEGTVDSDDGGIDHEGRDEEGFDIGLEDDEDGEEDEGAEGLNEDGSHVPDLAGVNAELLKERGLVIEGDGADEEGVTGGSGRETPRWWVSDGEQGGEKGRGEGTHGWEASSDLVGDLRCTRVGGRSATVSREERRAEGKALTVGSLRAVEQGILIKVGRDLGGAKRMRGPDQAVRTRQRGGERGDGGWWRGGGGRERVVARVVEALIPC